ncbi:MAG: hypothetical protein HFI75_05050 [Lachnospiraceae bacterium]|nr:hypothetical protein [Lachnospiraceae bacterium]
MQEALFYSGIICAVFAVGFMVTSVVMFVKFRVPTLWRDSKGTLERSQIEEIRSKNSNAANNHGKVNVFEELEKKAKVRKGNTQSLNLGTTTSSGSFGTGANDSGTVVLQNEHKNNPDFIIEKNMMFVSTSEVI